MKLQYLCEFAKGNSNALNTALRLAQCEIHVSVPEDWMEQMVEAFAQSQADAVVGKIVPAEDLARPSLGPLQRWWLTGGLCPRVWKPAGGSI
jgi:phage terminase large subunit-like protein